MQAETDKVTEEDTDLSTSLSGGYGVFVHNDDITPYDFVIGVLIRFFKLNARDAEAITVTALNIGIALVAVLPLSDAEAKVGRLFCRAIIILMEEVAL